MKNIREKGLECLDNPTSGPGKAYAMLSLVLIFMTVFQVVLETKSHEFV